MKPTYKVSSMAEIRSLESNGIKVVSTFSGCGGSSLGYRMNGCEVLAASEFIPAAIETYKANASPSTVVFSDDIRTLTGETIMNTLGLDVGQLDILDGSPPCSAFSTAGSRSKGWGEVHAYSDTKQRVDDLFYEYARLVNDLQPRAFIAENVSGLVKGSAKGYFKRIYATLQEAGYEVTASVLDASWLGVPQQRQRLFIVGIRNDLGIKPQIVKPLPYRYVLQDALEIFPKTRITHDPETNDLIDFTDQAIYKEWKKLSQGSSSQKYFQLVRCARNKPCNTITATSGMLGAASATHPDDPRKFSLAELRRICSFPDDFILIGDYKQRAERLGRSVPPVMMKHISETVINQLQQGRK
jgi:DNA (cytosine-5)-methyltransferase 1